MYKRYKIVHNGEIYHAALYDCFWGENKYELRVWCDAGRFRHEFNRRYKLLRSAENKLKKYFKGEIVDWREI